VKYRFDEIRHFVNREIDYGFSVAIDMSDRGALGFECFMIVGTQWLGSDDRKPLYLLADRFDDLADHFNRPEEGVEDYRKWVTDNAQQAKPVISGQIEWQNQMEASGDVPYFTGRELATEYGRLFERLYDLADEFLGSEEDDEGEED
jgi:hypothetical protein